MYIKEIAASLYPWDLADCTAEKCVDDLMEHSGVNSVYLVGLMHKEKGLGYLFRGTDLYPLTRSHRILE